MLEQLDDQQFLYNENFSILKKKNLPPADETPLHHPQLYPDQFSLETDSSWIQNTGYFHQLTDKVLIHSENGQDLFINTTKDEVLATGQEVHLPKKIFVRRGNRSKAKDWELLGGLMKSYGFGDMGVMGRAGRGEGLRVRMEAGMDQEIVDLC